MFEFRVTDFYDVAEVIQAAYEKNDLYDKNDENVLFDSDVSTTIIRITQRRFRVVISDDDEEYYKRLEYLFKESFKRYLSLYS